MELRKPLVVAIMAAAGGAAVARAMPSIRPPSSPAMAWDAGSPAASVSRAARGDIPVSSEPPRHRYSAPTSGVVVYVAGQVMHPGVYRLADGARAVQALHVAGGPTRTADLVAVDLAQRVEDGTEIDVPAQGSGAVGDAISGVPSRGVHRRHAKHRRRHRAVSATDDQPSADPLAAPVSLNTADTAQLQTLPGIGPALAARIIAFRAANGPFASVDELLDVAGMTQSKVDDVTPLIDLR